VARLEGLFAAKHVPAGDQNLAGDRRLGRVRLAGPRLDVGVERRWSTVGLYRVRDERIAGCWLLPLEPEAFDEIWAAAL
jgi:hypothetical protein